MTGILMQSIFGIALYYYIGVCVICVLLFFWKRQSIYGLIIVLSAINVDLQQMRSVDFGERNLLFSGVVIGEAQYEHHTKLLIHIDRIMIDDDTIGCYLPVEFYAYERNVFLGKRLYIKGRIRRSKFAYRPNALAGHIIASEVARHPFGFLFYPIRTSIDRTLSVSLKDDHYRIAKGLILGGSGQLGRELRNVFSRAGILHVLAVSGLHVGFVAMFVGFLLIFIPLDYRLKMFIILCGLILYAGVTGFRPSVCRATFMAVLLGLAVILQRNVDHTHIINITAIVFLVVSPSLIFDVSAQLSFAAVYGILYLYPRIRTRFIVSVRPRFLRLILVPMAVSFSAQLFVAPFIVYYFHRLPMYAVLANIIIIPIASVIIFLLLLGFLVGSVCFVLVKIIAAPVSLLIMVLIAISDFFAGLPLSAVELTVSPLITFPLYLLVWDKSRKIVIWLAMGILATLTLAQFVDCLTVRAVSESILITTPAGANIFICPKQGSSQQMFLTRQGINEVDYLIAPSQFCRVRKAYIPLPDKTRFKELRCNDLVIHISDRIAIVYHDAVMEFDLRSLRGRHRSGDIICLLSNGHEKHTVRGSLYGSIVEQMIFDAHVVVCRIRLLF